MTHVERALRTAGLDVSPNRNYNLLSSISMETTYKFLEKTGVGKKADPWGSVQTYNSPVPLESLQSAGVIGQEMLDAARTFQALTKDPEALKQEPREQKKLFEGFAAALDAVKPETALSVETFAGQQPASPQPRV